MTGVVNGVQVIDGLMLIVGLAWNWKEPTA